jgi:hypothetical protein
LEGDQEEAQYSEQVQANPFMPGGEGEQEVATTLPPTQQPLAAVVAKIKAAKPKDKPQEELEIHQLQWFVKLSDGKKKRH